MQNMQNMQAAMFMNAMGMNAMNGMNGMNPMNMSGCLNLRIAGIELKLALPAFSHCSPSMWGLYTTVGLPKVLKAGKASSNSW